MKESEEVLNLARAKRGYKLGIGPAMDFFVGWQDALDYAKEPQTAETCPLGHPKSCLHLVVYDRPNSPPGNHMECSWCASLRAEREQQDTEWTKALDAATGQTYDCTAMPDEAHEYIEQEREKALAEAQTIASFWLTPDAIKEEIRKLREGGSR